MSSAAEDVSITATEATVAGSSVAATEAEEDASFSPPTVDDEGNKVVLTKEESLDISIATGKEEEDEEENGEYTAPMHLHALRAPAKLKGARSRSSSRSRPSSRRNSQSPGREIVGEIIGGTVSPSISVGSSLDGHGEHHHQELDPDVLLDKLGFRDLDPNITQEQLQEMLRKHISSNSGLPTLNERMSEETLDDVHAFQDLSFVKRGSQDGEEGEPASPKGHRRDASGGLSGSAVMGSALNTLAEGDDEEEEGEEDGEEDVILDIPVGLVSGSDDKSKRSTMCSTAAIAAASSIDDDVDDDNAEVEVPTSVMNELKIGEQRHLKRGDTSMAVAGSEMDFLEDDEQDGLEADLASDEEPR